jgi:hypothetical protein
MLQGGDIVERIAIDHDQIRRPTMSLALMASRVSTSMTSRATAERNR